MKKVGVILARFQPIHNGHLELIKKAAEENEQVIVFIGSADKVNLLMNLTIATIGDFISIPK